MVDQVAKTFSELVELKFQLYNSLFLTLPLDAVEQTGTLLPLLSEACTQGLERGMSPAGIVQKFFEVHRPRFNEKEQIQFLFKVIQYVERQVVLVDALEDASYSRIHRVAGKGSLVQLMERARDQTSEEEAERLSKRMMKGSFDLSDFLDQLQKIKKMGPIGDLLGMIPGMGNQLRQVKDQISDDATKQVEAIIQSMTPYERRHPESISSSRRRRIARGSGTSTSDVNQLLSQFKEMRKMMGQMGNMAKKGRMPKGFPPLR